jgi:site-specific recombinase XerD
MKGLMAEFGNSVAQEIAPERIEAWLDTRSEWTIATRNRYIALLKLVYRLAEQYGMEWSNVDFEAGVITVPLSKHGEKRYVHMNSRVKAILAAAKARSLGTGRVFSCQNARHWFEPSVVDAGISGFLWHDLRHTFVSRLVMSGADLRTVQDLAGHKTIQMTMRYAHLAPSHLQAAIERLVPSATSTATAEIEAGKADQASIH